MSLSSILEGASSGLRATQAALDVVSQNVANAGSVGYTRRVAVQAQALYGNQTDGVRVTGVQRTLDTMLQRQLRLETAGAAYTGTLASAHTALDLAFDQTTGASSLTGVIDSFASSLQTLTNGPSLYQNRAAAIAAASDLAGSLNGVTGQVQTLRQNAETGLSQDVSSANDLLQQIAGLNGTIVSSPENAASAALLDQRDALIDKLSGYLDIKATTSPTGSVTIATTSGLQLFDGNTAVKLSFDQHSPLAAEAVYSSDPAKRGVGTVTATDAQGRKTDLVALGGIRSGSIAANLELRDSVLPQAQAQLDALAGALSSAFSDKTIPGVAVAAGTQSGFDLDLSPLASGNTFTLDTTDASGPGSVTFVKVTNPAALPLPPNALGTGGRVVGIDFSNGYASVAAQVQAALGATSAYVASNPSGATLRIVNGTAGATSVIGLVGKATVSGTQSGDPQLPLFVDGGRGNAPYTGSFDAGSQLVGYAGRVTINPAVKADPSTLVAYAAATPSGDTTRPSFLSGMLSAGTQSFTARAGLGSESAGFSGTIAQFAQQVVSKQAADSIAATNLDDGQKTVLNTITGRYAEQAGVNIDTELTQLIQLQTAYGANARILTAAKDLNDLLLNAVR